MSDDPYGERQLEILRSLFGDHSPQVRARLGVALQAALGAEDWPAVPGLARELLAVCDVTAPAGTDETLAALRALGEALLRRGEVEDARWLWLRAEQLAVGLGVPPEELASDRLQLARALRGAGDPAGALTRANEALDALQVAVAPEVDVARAQLLLVIFAAESGEAAAALEQLTAARDASPALVDEHAAELFAALDSGGRSLATAGRAQEALSLAEAALSLTEAAGGDATERTDRLARCLTLVGGLRRRCELRDGAQEAWERALELQQARHGEDSPFAGVLLNNLGALRWDQGELQAGYELVRRANRMLSQAFGVAHPHTQSSGQALRRMREHLEQRQVEERNAALRQG